MNGTEWVVEAYGCDPVRLASLASMCALFDAMVAELSLNPVGETLWHQFPSPGGITGMLLLAESHLTVHTFPEHGSLCLNLFCCTPRESWAWRERLGALVGAQEIHVRTVPRPYGPRVVANRSASASNSSTDSIAGELTREAVEAVFEVIGGVLR